jgi:hypothetical protein
MGIGLGMKAVGVCPLCGEIIERTLSFEESYEHVPVYTTRPRASCMVSRGISTVRVTWMCAAGCNIEVTGTRPHNIDFSNRIDDVVPPQEPEPLTGERFSELLPKAECAKHALEELEEGMTSHAESKDGGDNSSG